MTLAYDMERLVHLLRNVKHLCNDILVRHGESLDTRTYIALVVANGNTIGTLKVLASAARPVGDVSSAAPSEPAQEEPRP